MAVFCRFGATLNLAGMVNQSGAATLPDQPLGKGNSFARLHQSILERPVNGIGPCVGGILAVDVGVDGVLPADQLFGFGLFRGGLA